MRKKKKMPSQSQKNSEAIQSLDKKVALIEADIKSIKDNHLHTIEHKINILTKVVLALSFMFTIVFAETVKTFIDIITL
jgi:hypothetical protein